jgi:hypothetical protein
MVCDDVPDRRVEAVEHDRLAVFARLISLIKISALSD